MEAVRHVTPFRKKPEKMWVLAYQAHFYVCTDCARSGALQKPALGMHIMGITGNDVEKKNHTQTCLLYTSPSPRDLSTSRMPSSA